MTSTPHSKNPNFVYLSTQASAIATGELKTTVNGARVVQLSKSWTLPSNNRNFFSQLHSLLTKLPLTLVEA